MTSEQYAIDKSGWPAGPWMDEPDKLQWKDSATGLPCLIVRNHRGALCGYVGVAPGHPWYKIEYNECARRIEVHGGLTYSDSCQGHICHVPEPGEPENVWWFGFDCNHAGDFNPSQRTNIYRIFMGDDTPDGEYRTLDYVQAQCAKLAEQLAAIKPGEPK